MHRYYLLVLLLICLLCTGCPSAGKGASQAKGSAPDEQNTYAKLITTETGAQDELKRLQGLSTQAAQPGGSGAANADYQLSIETGGNMVDIVIKGADGARWVLRAWTQNPQQNMLVKEIKNEPTTGGYTFEANIGEALMYNLQLAWLPGGGLRITRSLMLGGLDLTYACEPGNCDWEFSGPWLPYRFVPQAVGPCGVVPTAGNAWQSAVYPGVCRVPAVAAYDAQRGWLLGVADEHARKADRRCELGWQVNGDYVQGDLMKLSTGYYNSTIDGFDAGNLVSGLELRESIVLLPFTLTDTGEDPTTVEATSAQVVQVMARYVHELHYLPQQAARPAQGNVVRLAEWLEQSEDVNARLHALDQLSAQSAVKYALVSEGDLKAAAVNSELLAALAAIQIMPVLEQPGAGAGFAGGDVRNADYAAELLRGVARGSGQAGLPGLCWRLGAAVPATNEKAAAGQCVMSALIPQAVLVLKSAELARTARPEAVLLAEGWPSLYLPAFADGYISMPVAAQAGAGFNPLAARLDNLLMQAVFNSAPLVASPDGTLAGLVLAAPGCQAGFLLDKGLAQYPGFTAFSQHTDALSWNGLPELRAVYSNPVASTYSLEGERPALYQQLIAVEPAVWNNASCVWVVFAGIGGSVAVDYDNNLTVAWQENGAAKSWTQRLPVGYWTVDHPSPEAMQPGDVALVTKGSVAPAAEGGSVSM
jgi:hypothetical protein